MMEDYKDKESTLNIPKEAQEEAKKVLEDVFHLFAEHSKNIADELAEFNKKREQVRRRIKNGPRRTSGRIV